MGARRLQAFLDSRRDRREGVAAGNEQLRRIIHSGDFDQSIAQLCRIALLRTVVDRPRFLDIALADIVFDGVAGPSDILVVQQIRAEEARFDDRHLDAEPLDLDCDRQRDALDRELRCGVGGTVLKPDNASNGADVDDVARPLLTHNRQHRAHDVHHTIEVRSELAFDLGCGHLFKITKQAVARIVNQNVDTTEPLHRLLDCCFRLDLVRNVQLDKCQILACNIAQGITHFVQVSAGRDYTIASLQCRLGDSGANAAAGTCNKPNFVHNYFPLIRT